MSDKRLEQYALDWAAIMDGLQRKCEAEMNAAYKAGDPDRYMFPALLAGEIRSARQVMFGMLTFPIADPTDPILEESSS